MAQVSEQQGWANFFASFKSLKPLPAATSTPIGLSSGVGIAQTPIGLTPKTGTQAQGVDHAGTVNLAAPIGAAAATGFPGAGIPAFNLALSGGVSDTPIQASATPTTIDPTIPTGGANLPIIGAVNPMALLIGAAVIAALVFLRK